MDKNEIKVMSQYANEMVSNMFVCPQDKLPAYDLVSFGVRYDLYVLVVSSFIYGLPLNTFFLISSSTMIIQMISAKISD